MVGKAGTRYDFRYRFPLGWLGLSVDKGMGHSEQNVYTEYADPKRTEWITKIQPALKKAKLEVLVGACGKRLCRREIIELQASRKKPHRRTQQLLESILKRLGFL